MTVLHQDKTFVFLDELGQAVALPHNLLLHLVQISLRDLDERLRGLDVLLHKRCMGGLLEARVYILAQDVAYVVLSTVPEVYRSCPVTGKVEELACLGNVAGASADVD